MNEISVKRVKEVHNKCQSFSLAADETSESPSRFAELPILPNFSISQLHIANFEF